ncbi:MAG: Toxin HigB-1 [Turneriella sp.]|nr:Toxin HigB-1 [Turneriella sp.]
MILSFKDKETKKIFNEEVSRKFPLEIQRAVLRKLLAIDSAHVIEDLRVPIGNRLEKLKADRKEQYSVRVNNQYRICFQWQNGNAINVELCDYH